MTQRLAQSCRPAAFALVCALALASCSGAGAPARKAAPPAPPLAELVERLSEPSGAFDTDNLVSNETAYLQAADLLDERAPKGGAYLGVGPEQNFSYIARVRPRWAFILDVRRENLVQQLYLNALLEHASTPLEYLCWLLARPLPTPGTAPPPAAGLEATLAALAPLAPSAALLEERLDAIERHIVGRLHVPLDAADRHHLRRIATAFYEAQLGLRFETYGQGLRLWHPTYRTLLAARSPSGRFGHFLASADDYAFVRGLVRAGRVVPVVGDFAGEHALAAIGDFLREQHEHVSAFYVSNVEFYLIRDGGFDRFVANVRRLPLDEGAVFIRAVFHYGRPHPERLPGHRSSTLLQPIRRFLALRSEHAFASDAELLRRDYLR